VKPGAIPPDALLVPKRPDKGLPQRNAAILNRVVRVHLQIAPASKPQIDRRMLRKQRQHVVEEWNAGPDGGLARAIQVEPDGDAGLFGQTLDRGKALLH
jgi:hypothetical protein